MLLYWFCDEMSSAAQGKGRESALLSLPFSILYHRREAKDRLEEVAVDGERHLATSCWSAHQQRVWYAVFLFHLHEALPRFALSYYFFYSHCCLLIDGLIG